MEDISFVCFVVFVCFPLGEGGTEQWRGRFSLPSPGCAGREREQPDPARCLLPGEGAGTADVGVGNCSSSQGTERVVFLKN